MPESAREDYRELSETSCRVDTPILKLVGAAPPFTSHEKDAEIDGGPRDPLSVQLGRREFAGICEVLPLRIASSSLLWRISLS